MLLVLMSLEKCFAVYFPFKSKAVCTIRTAKWANGVAGIILAGYNSMFFFIIKAGIIESSGYDTCVYTVDMTGALDIVDSIPYSFGPFTFIFISNFAIVFKSIRSKFNSRSSSRESTNQALVKAATRGTAMVVLSLFPLHFYSLQYRLQYPILVRLQLALSMFQATVSSRI